MDDMLCQVPRGFQLRDQGVGVPQIPREIESLKPSLFCKDLSYLGCEYLVLLLFSVEVLGAFRRVVYDLGDLEEVLAGLWRQKVLPACSLPYL